MRHELSWLMVSAALMYFFPARVAAYDSYVLNSLQRSQDALRSQQTDLKQAYDETSRQVSALQQKLIRLDGYLRQVEQSLRDVNRAIDQAR